MSNNMADKIRELPHAIEGTAELGRCCTCRRSLDDVGVRALIPVLTADCKVAAICPDCLKGTPCIGCGSTDTAETTYYGLVFCKDCMNRSPKPLVTVEVDERDLPALEELLSCYKEER